MVLRLEDTDQSRLVPGAAAALDAMLQWASTAFSPHQLALRHR